MSKSFTWKSCGSHVKIQISKQRRELTLLNFSEEQWFLKRNQIRMKLQVAIYTSLLNLQVCSKFTHTCAFLQRIEIMHVALGGFKV